MTKYTFWIEGLGREVEREALTSKEARMHIWNYVLTSEERDAVEYFDLIDQVPA